MEIHAAYTDHLSFLSGGGEMGKLIQAYDWSQTALGSIYMWPQSLKTTVNLILQSPVPFAILWGSEGIMIYNDGYARIAAQRHPFILGSKVEDAWPEVSDFNKNVIDTCLQGRTLSYKDQQLTLYRNNVPEEVWMDLNYSPVMDESGQPAGVLAIVVETTQRIMAELNEKHAEEALKAERLRLHSLFMNAPAAIAILTGEQLEFTLANEPYRQLVGKDRILEGKPLMEAIPEIDQTLYSIVRNVSFKGERFVANELPVVLDWDTTGISYTKYLNFIYEPLFEEGKPNGLMAFAYDVSEQVKGRRVVEEQNKVLEMITGGAELTEALNFLVKSIEKHSSHKVMGSILLLDKDGKHLRHCAAPSLPDAYNAAIDGIAIGPGVGSCGTCAFTKAPVIVSDIATDPLWTDFKDLALQHGLRSCWSSPILSGDKLLGTFALYTPEVYTPTEEDKNKVEYATGTATLIIDRKRSEEVLTEKNKELTRINNDLDNFIYTASHDLKAPVSNLEGLFHTLLDEIHHDDNITLLKTMIEKSFGRFKNTIKDLTEITKVQKEDANEVELISLTEIIEDVKLGIIDQIDLYKPDIQLDLKVPELKFSRKNLRSIFYNLISNSIKYSAPQRKPVITITSEKLDDFVVLSIGDNGLGISEENKKRMFQMFKRFHDHVEGSGIGLYIVKRIIDNAGGRIEVDTTLDKGTTFKIFLKMRG
ncbi:MAG TPA: ATP-binding protein [Cytophagales bacterium]|nr:ATP-binding protein [Cytophagales bacterium]